MFKMKKPIGHCEEDNSSTTKDEKENPAKKPSFLALWWLVTNWKA